MKKSGISPIISRAKLWWSMQSKQVKGLSVAIVFAGLGAATILSTSAEKIFITIELDTGQRGGSAAIVKDASAAGGKYIMFSKNAPVSTTTDGSKSTASGGSTSSPGGQSGQGGSSGGGGSSSGSCALPKYPDETCTGVPAGTALAAHSGDLNVNTNNATVENKNVTGCIVIGNVTGITLRKIKAKCIYNEDRGDIGMRVLVEDSEINCGGTGGSTGVSEANITLRRVEITNCENGLDINQYITIEDSYIHELYENPVIDTHTDGMQFAQGHFEGGNIVYGAREVVVRHNTIYAYNRNSGLHGTSSIIMNNTNDGPGSKNILVRDNLLAGGAYTVYCNHPGTGNNLQIINNHFSKQFSPSVGAFGPWTDCGDEAQVSGNVYHETGQAVPL